MRRMVRRPLLLRRSLNGLGVIVQAPADDGSTFARNQGTQPQYALPGDGSSIRDALANLVLQLKSDALDHVESTVRSNLIPMGGVMPADANPIIQANAIQYPAAGAAASSVLSYTPAKGTVLVITQISITHIGGNPPDFSGNVIWRLSIDGAWVKGMDSMQYQTGTQSAPAQISPLFVLEGQQFLVTTEVPPAALQPPGAGTQTAARFLGFTYPLARLYKS